MVGNPTDETRLEGTQGEAAPTRGTVHLERPIVRLNDGSFEQLTFRGRGASHFGAIRGGGDRMHLANDYFYETGTELLVPEGASGKWTMRHVGIESGVGGQNSFWEIGRDHAGNPILMSSRHNARSPEGFDGPQAAQRGASGFSGGQDYGIRVGEGRQLAIAGATGTNTTDPHFDLGLSRLMPDGTQQRIDSEWAFAQVEAGADPNSEEFWQAGIEHTRQRSQELAAQTGGSADRYFNGAMGSQGAWRVDHVAGNLPSDYVAEEDEEIPAEFYTAQLGSGSNGYSEYTSAELLALIGTSTQEELANMDIWTGHSNSAGATAAVRNLQTTELQNYYPQAGTEGLSARAQQIAGDGLVGEITHHGAQLSQDEDGSFARSHIAEALQSHGWGDSTLLKLDASLNRYAELTEGADVVPVDGVFREADAARVSQFIEEWRAENDGQSFELGNAAVRNMIQNGQTIEGLAELTGMDAAAIEEANLAVGNSAIAIDNPELGAVLDVIAAAEGTSGPNGYNAAFGHGNGEHGVDFSTMTVDEVHAWSRSNGFGSSAVTRYQIMYDTMPDVKAGLGLTGDELMTPELQDRMAVHLLERRGLQDYLNGEISTDRMIDRMAHEWAGLSDSNGNSVYAGVGHNRATGDNSHATRTALEALRESYQNPRPTPEAQPEAPAAVAEEDLLLSSADAPAPSARDGFQEVAGTQATVAIMGGADLSTTFATADAPITHDEPANAPSENKVAFAGASDGTPKPDAPAEEQVAEATPVTPRPQEAAPVMA